MGQVRSVKQRREEGEEDYSFFLPWGFILTLTPNPSERFGSFPWRNDYTDAADPNHDQRDIGRLADTQFLKTP